MTEQTRERRLMQTLVTLADTLVAGYDTVDLLQSLVDSCGELLESTASGILLDAGDRRLEVIASSEEGAEIVELLQISTDSGPCIECFRTGATVSMPDIATDDEWPEFREVALAQGYRSLHAVPLRLRETTIGSMNLFRSAPGALDDDSAAMARALADMATIGILQERALREADVARDQLQRALDSRVVIEQAKGVIAQTRGIDMSAAFDLLRGYARQNQLGLSVVAEQVVSRALRI